MLLDIFLLPCTLSFLRYASRLPSILVPEDNARPGPRCVVRHRDHSGRARPHGLGIQEPNQAGIDMSIAAGA
ncbi:hypothetical protein BD309DRAFT_176519 [Dichomitus squalens]|nr:hypothetical protein BD309DRAFT_176519 [Dichomitus squalens]